MSNRRRRKKDGLHSKVQDYIPRSDDNGDYVGYCDFSAHKGIVLDDYVCDKRHCKYYCKLYIGSIGKLNGLGEILNDG